MSECNYVISVPGKRYTKQTVHINRLKKWVEPKANLFRVVVSDEEIHEPVGKVCMPFGLKNVPAAFERCMLKTLSHLPGCSLTYIDDVITHTIGGLILIINWQHWIPLE